MNAPDRQEQESLTGSQDMKSAPCPGRFHLTDDWVTNNHMECLSCGISYADHVPEGAALQAAEVMHLQAAPVVKESLTTDQISAAETVALPRPVEEGPNKWNLALTFPESCPRVDAEYVAKAIHAYPYLLASFKLDKERLSNMEALVVYLEGEITSGRVSEIELTSELMDLIAEARRSLVLPSVKSADKERIAALQDENRFLKERNDLLNAVKVVNSIAINEVAK